MSEIQADGVTEMSSGAPLPDSTNSMTAYLGYVRLSRHICFMATAVVSHKTPVLHPNNRIIISGL